MGQTPSSSGECCLPNVEELTYPNVGARQTTIVMRSLDAIFKQLFDSHRRPEDAGEGELIGVARRFNCIPGKRM